MKKVLTILTLITLSFSCKEGGDLVSPEDVNGKHFSEIDQYIFYLIQDRQFSELNNGFNFSEEVHTNIKEVFYLTIGDKLVPFNSVYCESVYSNGFYTGEIVVAEYLENEEAIRQIYFFYEGIAGTSNIEYSVGYIEGDFRFHDHGGDLVVNKNFIDFEIIQFHRWRFTDRGLEDETYLFMEGIIYC